MMKIYRGQRIYTKAGKYYGHVVEVLDGAVRVKLHRTAYTDADSLEDAGIPAGQPCNHAFLSLQQITFDNADDNAYSAGSYHTPDRDTDELVSECDSGHIWAGDEQMCPTCDEPAV